jgi:hypothetical protein
VEWLTKSIEEGGYALTEDAAKTLVNSLITHSPGTAGDLRNNDYNAEIDKLIEEGINRFGGKNNQSIISQYEIDYMATINGVSPATFEADLRSRLGQGQELKIIPKLEDESGNPFNIKETLTAVLGENYTTEDIAEFLGVNLDGSGTITIDADAAI